MTRYVTIKLFLKLSGCTENAIHSKKSRGVPLQDSDWREAPDGRQLVSIDGYESWTVGPKTGQQFNRVSIGGSRYAEGTSW